MGVFLNINFSNYPIDAFFFLKKTNNIDCIFKKKATNLKILRK